MWNTTILIGCFTLKILFLRSTEIKKIVIRMVSLECLTRELLAKYSCLHPVLTLHIPVMCKTHASFRGMLSRKLLAKTLLSSIAWIFTHSLSITQPLQLNPTINTVYKQLNKITIKFVIELNPTKHIVVNYNTKIEQQESLSKTYKTLKNLFGFDQQEIEHTHHIWTCTIIQMR